VFANVAPPSPSNLKEFAEYQIGLIWGALQGLFGIVAAVAAIPAIVQFMKSFFQQVGQGGFWHTVWAMLKAQWDSFADLFTRVVDLDARGRGELLGSVLIGVILLVIETLTGLAETGVALEFTAAGILRALKATGKLGLEHVREFPGALRETVAMARSGASHGFEIAVDGRRGYSGARACPSNGTRRSARCATVCTSTGATSSGRMFSNLRT
jgi:hypothetical protein